MSKIIENWDWWYFAEHNKALATSLIVVLVLVLAYAIAQVVFRVLKSQLKARDFTLFTLFRNNCYSPGIMVFLGFGLVVLLPFIPIDKLLLGPINRGLAIFQICCVAWLLIRIIKSLRDYLVYKYVREGGTTEISARKVLTQFRIFGRVLVFIIVLLALTASLMTFDQVRQVGYSILASAGLLSVIVGFAAQRSIGTVLAGIQIAIAQPIRIDDVVVVEGEWGRVEEITLTYVVLRIWDERRMVVPINYFIEKPFFNWTRNTNQITGTVKIPIDYRANVEAIRVQFSNLVSTSSLWDKRKAMLQVTDFTDRIMELRMIVSAGDADSLFDLRCEIREGMIAFIADQMPEMLPQGRVFGMNPSDKEETDAERMLKGNQPSDNEQQK